MIRRPSPGPPPIDLSGEAFAPLTSPVRIAFVLGPPAGFVLVLGVIAIVASPTAAGFIAGMALGTMVGGGKLVVLAGAVEEAPVGPWGLAALIVYLDVGAALLTLGSMHLLYRLPGAGRRLAAARAAGWRVLQRNPWMYRITWLSLAGFIAVPFQGTGAVAGVVLGRLLGLSRPAIVLATALGSIVGAGALAAMGDYWEERITALAGQPWLGFLAAVTVLGVTIVGGHLVFGRADRNGPGL